jgi:spoIIIJ-associated protein
VEWVETTGRTVDDAKDAALDQLGVDEQEAEFELLEEPRSGLFGRTRGEARVRARVKPRQPRAKAERGNRRRRSGGEGKGNNRSRSGRGKGGRSNDAADKPADRPDDGRKKDVARNDRPEAPVIAAPPARDERDEDAPAATSRGRGRGRNASSSPADKTEQSVAPATATKEQAVTSDDVTVEEQAEIVEGFLEGLVDAFGVDAEIRQERIDDETIELDLVGADLGLLIGPKGRTLWAIQELSRTVVQRQATGTHHGRVRIDVGGYRQRRKEALERFTRQLAGEVQESGVARSLEPMGAADRKIVHDTVNDMDGISTTSEGEEPRRRVVIVPGD